MILALRDFFPPQAIEDPPAPLALDDDDDAVLLSLPHAVSAATATTDAVPTNALPKLVRSTVPTFRQDSGPFKLQGRNATYAAVVATSLMDG